MKIAIVTNLYPPYGRGGAEIVITRIVTELLAEGHEVFVITSRPFGGLKTLFPHLEDRANEMIYRFSPLNIYHPLRDFKHPKGIRLLWHLIDMFNPMNGLFVRRLIKDIAPDVVWTHNLKGIGLTIPMFIRSLGIPLVHHVHDVQLSVPSGLILAGKEKRSWFVRLLRGQYTRMCRWFMGSPDVVISPSTFLKQFYEERGLFRKSPMIVMPNPAPKMKQMPRGQRPAGPLRLVIIGQLERHKGLTFLVESLQAFDRPFELTVAGDGTLRGFIEQVSAIDRRFHYVGFLAMTQLIKLFQTADALVVPSLCYENSPTVIYEALQSGLPVVAANIGGVAELVTEDVNGFLFRPADHEDLLAALRCMDEAKENLRTREDAIRATVAEHAIGRYTKRLVDIFQACCSEQKVLP